MSTNKQERLVGCLLGTAVGDALGLPAEGIGPARIARLWRGPWRHRLVFGRGMVSDDTEHSFFVTQAMLAHPNDAKGFAGNLAWRLRFWLLGLPAGTGLATARAIFKLWVAFPPSRSGVFSAGNGPAMRVAPIGVRYWDEPETMNAFVEASTRLTHTDPKALLGSLVVARLAGWASRRAIDQNFDFEEAIKLLKVDRRILENPRNRPSSIDNALNDWSEIVQEIREAHAKEESVEDFCGRLGLSSGVSGYIYHSVPVAIYAWMRHYGDYQKTHVSVIERGGDTDTVGAIAGALAGASVGESGIPAEWIDNIIEWPRTIGKMKEAAARLARQSDAPESVRPVTFFWPALIIRNLIFLVIVLLHGFRRLLPPY